MKTNNIFWTFSEKYGKMANKNVKNAEKGSGIDQKG